MMRDRIRLSALIGLGLVIVMGCSGGGAAATGAPSQAAPRSAAPGASQAPAATSAASVAGVPTQAPGGGNLAGVCSLVTTDELATILGTAVTTRVLAGPPDTCDVQAAGAPILAFVLTTTGGGPVYGAYAADPGATTISGIGDKAAYAPSQQLLLVLKGDAVLSMSAFDPAKTPEERLEIMKKVAAIAAGRM